MAENFTTNGLIGTDQPRIDGAAKVTGTARYGADHALENPAYAYLALSGIARGKITLIDERIARAIPGVLDIFTYKNAGNNVVKHGKPMMKLGYSSTTLPPLDADIQFAGQVVAVVIADSFETARAAALALRITYRSERPAATFGSTGTETVDAKSMQETELNSGDFLTAFDAAPVKISAEYCTPAQHHNPMELFQTTCTWNGDTLTIHESTQSARGIQRGVAKQLGIDHRDIRVVSDYVGGAFGSRGDVASTTAVVAHAARMLKRPIKLVVSRQQGFTLRSFRAETKHRVQLAAGREGHLQALSHESWELTSRNQNFSVAGSASSARLYACPNIRTRVHNVKTDRQTPGFMRAPPETPYLFAHESAMDELAYALGLDPIELRRRNDTKFEPIKQLPYTSRALMPCFDAAAKAFGWANREPKPGIMREGAWRIGYGCATATYPVQIGPARCRLTLFPTGRAKVEIGTQDIGQGAYTALAQTVADQLRIPMDRVEVVLGSSDLPSTPITGGSSGAASACNAAAKACRELRGKLGSHALPDAPLTVEVSNNPSGAPPLIGPMLVDRGHPILVGGIMKHCAQFSFGAHLVEVRVHEATGEIRVSRVVGAFAAGRIINPRTAKSQLMGGQIWGIAAALSEASLVDEKTARYVNPDLAEYYLAVNADIGHVTTLIVPEEDSTINQLGIKGIGELGITGMNAAVANAVFHATGQRIRTLPIRLDDLITA